MNEGEREGSKGRYVGGELYVRQVVSELGREIILRKGRK